MCGIVGAVGQKEIVSDLIHGLKKLEYRGYDSAGIGLVHEGSIACRKATGELENLEELLKQNPIDAHVGISHTRWATHGTPTLENTHPHENGDVCVVHNGIVENYAELKDFLIGKGHIFKSDTDSEVIPHLVSYYMNKGYSPTNAAHRALKKLNGAYAVNIVFKDRDDFMIAARNQSPLLIGHGEQAMYAASDAMAIAAMAQEVSYLENKDFAVLTKGNVEIFDSEGNVVERKKEKTDMFNEAVSKKEYQYFMEKEMHEQPDVVSKTLLNACDLNNSKIKDRFTNIDFQNIDRLTIVACGTSFYAGQIAKYWFERYANLPTDVDIASEFRYREAPMRKGGAALFISQSGETADTLAALQYAKSYNQKIISLVNVTGSSIARESDSVIETHAGPEIGVASTKAFTAQLTSLALLAIESGWQRGALQGDDAGRLVDTLKDVPTLLLQSLKDKKSFKEIARTLKDKPSTLFIGRGICFPLVMEGALKLKEISYIHAEGFGAGELKHGPIALVSEEMPVVALAPSDNFFEKMHSSIKEVQARGAKIILLSDKEEKHFKDIEIEHRVKMAKCDPFIIPFLYTIPLQFIAYYTALAKGTNIDKPRNLAKSVTVE